MFSAGFPGEDLFVGHVWVKWLDYFCSSPSLRFSSGFCYQDLESKTTEKLHPVFSFLFPQFP